MRLAVDPAEVAVPADGDDVGKHDAMGQGHVGEVDELDERPDTPVSLEGRPPRRLELLLGAGALHGGHAAEEDADHDGGEAALVDGHAGEGGEPRVGRVDAACDEVEPSGSHRAEDAFSKV